MAPVAEHAGDQLRRTVTTALQVDIVVEFEGEHVHPGECRTNAVRDRSEIRRVTERPAEGTAFLDAVDAKGESRIAVVRHANRPARQSFDQRERFRVGIRAHQPGLGEIDEIGRNGIQMLRVPGMQDEWHAFAPQPLQRERLPVVAVRVGQRDGGYVRPFRAEGGEPFRKDARADSAIDEQAESAMRQERRVAAAAASEDREPGGHADFS
jgi:hypothetical protein